MSLSDPVATNSAHNTMMEQLRNLITQATSILTRADGALDALSEHNEASNAHPNLLDSLVTESDVTTIADTRISEHNTVDTAHSTLVATLRAEIKDTSAVLAEVDSLISAHDSSATAHSDIRASMSEIKLQIGSNNLTDMSEQLTTLTDQINNDIAIDIAALQTKDAEHDSLILTNKNDIEVLSTGYSAMSTTVDTLYHTTLFNQSSLDSVKLETHALDRNERFGYVQAMENGVNLESFSHSLPAYVCGDTEYSFSFSNMIDNTGESNVTCSISEVSDGWTIAPMTGFGNASSLTASVAENAEPGDILFFTLVMTDTTSNVVTKRTINAYVSPPTDADSIVITGIPTSTEPGSVYTLSVYNPNDTAGTFTYAMQNVDTEITFSKIEGIESGESFNMTISEDAVRGTSLSFQMLIANGSETPMMKIFEISVNPLPDITGFSHTTPSVVVPNNSYTVKFYGVTSVSGIPVTYSISYTGEDLVFSKTENILANENVLITVSAGATRGATCSFIANAHDECGNVIPISVSTQVNELPTATTVTTTLPESTFGGVTLEMIVSGGNDAESNGSLKYSIDTGSSGFSFSKINNISNTDIVYVTIAKVSAASTRTFSVFTVDTNGEVSAAPKAISITINPVLLIDTPSILSPATGSEVNGEFTMTWSPYSTTVDLS